MRKLFLLLLFLLVLGSLSACGKDPEKDPNGNEGPVELHTDRTDALTLDPSEYEGKSFIADGIGVVELFRCVDGDTAHFREGQETFSVRFLGIDTPESTYRFDPWGKEASAYVCDRLENAETIVLEADPSTNRMDNNGRYLAFVWYDGRLINLEVIEQAYSTAQGVLNLRYGSIMMDAFYEAQNSRRRIFGETDPNFDYSKEGIQITIEELVTNQSEYIGIQVTLTGIVTRVVGNNAWLQQDGFGVYIYVGHVFTTRVAVGNELTIDRLIPTYFPDAQTGALQVSNVESRRITIVSSGNTVDPLVLNPGDVSTDHIGTLVQLQEVEITHRSGTASAFTLTVRGADGQTFQLRKDALSPNTIDYSQLTIGTKINVTGPIHIWNGVRQLMLTSPDDIEFINE
ncbi:thermonuclease family protein [Liberiplasma polymorphum]|uniref:thermonuclease family protein n=1 Tax=Liberiplasma polymorphum TaxID=3374570 RepID=UPI003770BF61